MRLSLNKVLGIWIQEKGAGPAGPGKDRGRTGEGPGKDQGWRWVWSGPAGPNVTGGSKGEQKLQRPGGVTL
jgi:hypothetical protein